MDIDFFLLQCVQTDSGGCTAEYPVVTRVQLDMTIQMDLFVVFSSYSRPVNNSYDRSFSVRFEIKMSHIS